MNVYDAIIELYKVPEIRLMELPSVVFMHPIDFRYFDLKKRKQLGLGRLPRKKKLKKYGRLK